MVAPAATSRRPVRPRPRSRPRSRPRELPGSQINALAYDQVSDGGTFTQALSQWVAQWNYNQANGTHDTVNQVIEPMMPTMFIANDKAELSNNPDYVTEWKMEQKDGKQVVTYKLNEKAKWSDGTPITIKDFQAQLKALSGKDKKYQATSTDGYDRVASVEQGASDHEVVVTYAKPYPDWPGMFSPLYPAAVNETPEAFNKSLIDKLSVTAGPFKLEKMDQTTKTATLVRDDAWWGRKAKLDKIIFRALENDATTNAFANGELSGMQVNPIAADLQRAKGVADVEIRKAAAPNWRHITVNGSSEFLKDKNVRQAVQPGHQPRDDHGVGPQGPRLAGPGAQQPPVHEHPQGLRGQLG